MREKVRPFKDCIRKLRKTIYSIYRLTGHIYFTLNNKSCIQHQRGIIYDIDDTLYYFDFFNLCKIDINSN